MDTPTPLPLLREQLQGRFASATRIERTCLDVGFLSGVQGLLTLLVEGEHVTVTGHTREVLLEATHYVRSLAAQIESETVTVMGGKPS